MALFTAPVDVANRGLQHLGIPRIATLTDSSKEATEANFALDKLRQAELQRVIWTFAVRRVMMRPVVSTTKTIVFLAYNAATTYAVGDVVVDSTGYLWISVVASNTAHTPGAGGPLIWWASYAGPTVAQAWDTAVSYVPGEMIYTSTVVYIAVAPSSAQAQPNATYWHVVAGATLVAGVAITTIDPRGYAPAGTLVKSIYRLPANYLRVASQDPKVAGAVQLNVTAGMRYNDWEIENGFLFTTQTPFVMRFVADQTDVTFMEQIFCEVWAARLAVELCETMTQSAEKLNNTIGLYTRYTNIARVVNAIEGGSSEEDTMDTPQAAGAQQGGR